MKSVSLLSTTLCTVLLSQGAFAASRQSVLDLGPGQVSQGCEMKPSKISLKKGVIQLPIRLSVALESEAGEVSVARKNCVVSIPLETPANRALVIDGVEVDQSQTLTVGTSSLLQVEVFKAGLQNQPLVIDNHAVKKNLISKSTVTQKTSVLFGCGQGGVLRVNASALLRTVQESSRSAARLSNLKISTKLIPCESGSL